MPAPLAFEFEPQVQRRFVAEQEKRGELGAEECELDFVVVEGGEVEFEVADVIRGRDTEVEGVVKQDVGKAEDLLVSDDYEAAAVVCECGFFGDCGADVGDLDAERLASG